MTKDNLKDETANSTNTVLPAVFGYHIFPPFVDAYMNSFWSEKQLPLDEIRKMMEGHANEWGKEVIGESVSRGREIPTHEGKMVLCCAYTYTGKDNKSDKNYLIVTNGGNADWYDKLEFVEGKVLDEWDVT